MPSKLTTLQIAQILYDTGYRYVNGRIYFTGQKVNGTYVKDEYVIEQKLYRHLLTVFNSKDASVISAITDAKKLKNIIESLVILSDSDEYLWPDNEIIRMCKENKNIPTKEEVLKIFPFMDEHFIIMNKILFDKTNERSLFIVTGIGGSGKSTFGNLVCQFYPDDVSPTQLSQLQGFGLAPALKAKLIYSDELGKNELDNSYLKQICSKQMIQVNNKFGSMEKIKSQSNMLYCCNKLPYLDISDSGLFRRICFLHMNKKIENPDPTMNRKEYTKEDLITIGTYVYNLKVEDDWFEKYFEKQTFDLIWTNNKLGYITSLLKVKLRDLTFTEFKKQCYESGLKAYSESSFSELKEIFIKWDQKLKEQQSIPSNSNA